MAKITTVGFDIAKNSSAAHGFDECGQTIAKVELRHGPVLSFSPSIRGA